MLYKNVSIIFDGAKIDIFKMRSKFFCKNFANLSKKAKNLIK